MIIELNTTTKNNSNRKKIFLKITNEIDENRNNIFFRFSIHFCRRLHTNDEKITIQIGE